MGAAQSGFLDTAYRPSPLSEAVTTPGAEASAGDRGHVLLPPGPAQHRAPPAGVVMVFSTSAFGTYFKLTEGAPSNSSHVDLLAPVSVEPAGASVGLAWLAVGSMCLFIAGERGPVGDKVGWGGRWGRPVTTGLTWPPASPGLLPSPLSICPHFCVYSSDHVPCTQLSPSLPLQRNPRRKAASSSRHLCRSIEKRPVCTERGAWPDGAVGRRSAGGRRTGGRRLDCRRPQPTPGGSAKLPPRGLLQTRGPDPAGPDTRLAPAGFAVGWGPIPWLLMSEIFPLHVKGVATGVCVLTNWLMAFLVTKEFSSLMVSTGPVASPPQGQQRSTF